jgi:tetratricopeptide (TPR) repeat protein
LLESDLLHCEYYLLVLEECDGLYKEGGEGVARALARFDEEREHVLLGQQRCAESWQLSERACSLCNRYPDVGALLLPLRLGLQDRLKWRLAGLEAARRLGKRSTEAAHLICLGNIYDELGETDQAVATYRRAVELKRELGDAAGEQSALVNWSIALTRAGRAKEALRRLQPVPSLPLGVVVVDDRLGKELPFASQDQVDAARGAALISLGEPETASEYLSRALLLARVHGDLRRETSVLVDQARAYVLAGHRESAGSALDRAITLARGLGDRGLEGLALLYRGQLAILEGRFDEGRSSIEEGRKTLRNAAGASPEGWAEISSAVATQAAGDPKRAVALYESLLSVARSAGNRHMEASVLRGLSSVLVDLGEVRKAMEAHEAVERIERERRAAGTESESSVEVI